MPGLAELVVVKFKTEAHALPALLSDISEIRLPLDAQSDIVRGVAVDHGRAGDVRMLFGIRKKCLLIVHDEVDRMDFRTVKKDLFITGIPDIGGDPESLRIHHKDSEDNCEGNCTIYYFVDMSASGHLHSPGTACIGSFFGHFHARLFFIAQYS